MKRGKKSQYTQYYIIYGLYCFFTLCAIYFSSFTKTIAGWVSQIDLTLDYALSEVLNSGPVALHLRHILALALTPIVIVAIPTAVYWGIKKKMPSYLIQSIWVIWIIAALSRLLSQ